MRQVEKAILLQTLDQLWREHLVTLDHLRQVIGLRGFGQRDPLNEYKTEGFTLFELMLTRLRETVTSQLMRVELTRGVPPELTDEDLPEMEAEHIDPFTGLNDMAEPEMAMADAGPVRGGAGAGLALAPARARKGEAPNPSDPATWGKIPRNSACPCGSGRKYKHCHGRLN